VFILFICGLINGKVFTDVMISLLFFIALNILPLSDQKVILDENSIGEYRYFNEEFSFAVGGKNQILTGTLSIPNGFDSVQKAVILISPPLPTSRDYNGLYSDLAEELLAKGIAVLRYDNRPFLDEELARKKAFTMHGQARDALDAFDALKKDQRFKNASIGLLGHSEGGASVAIAASQNSEIDFVVMMSTQGIPGDELSYSQFTGALDKIYHGDKEQKQLMYSCVRETIDIIDRNEDMDTMYILLKENNKHYYNTYRKKYPKFFGKLELKDIYKMDSINWLNPHRIAYVQYEPHLYYPKIACPALVVYGKKDEKLQWKENLNGIKQLFDQGSKSNYQLVLLDSINHSYQQYMPIDSIGFLVDNRYHNMEAGKKRPYSLQSFRRIAAWISLEL